MPERRYPSREWCGFRLLPEPKRANPLWSVASIIAHVVVLAIVVSVAGPTFLPEPEQPVTRIITLLPPGWVGPREYGMPALGGGGGEEGGEPEERGPPDRAAPGPDIDSVIPPPETDVQMIIGTETGEGDSLAIPGALGPRRLIRPAFGDGRLWVRAEEAALGVVGHDESIEAHVARVSEAVRERIKAFIDTMPADSFATAPPMDWTAEVGEDTWGIDGSWIYLGDFKIPNILLALIPLPQGNIDAAQDAAELARIRADIISAARRAETAEQFKEYVKEVRKRKQAERDSLRVIRMRRDSIVPPIPP